MKEKNIITSHKVYAAWEYKQDSPLRDLVAKVYKEMYQKDCVLEAIHAGVECGIFTAKLPGLDCVSYGPDLFDIHTTREAMSISSVKWRFLYHNTDKSRFQFLMIIGIFDKIL